MPFDFTRRQILAGLATVPALAAARPAGPIVDSHVHLFSNDLQRFPLAANATYKPTPLPVEEYVRFATEAKIDHAVIVHPEPYQDDHRYLEYAFTREPFPGFFKGVCLFDPTAPGTPDRISSLVDLHPGRIVALRIHEVHAPGTPSLTSGPIKDRDMSSPAMRATWERVRQLKLAIQMHFLPYYAPQIGELAARFPDVPVILDHLGRTPEGTPAEQAEVMKLGKQPQIYMKYSNVKADAKPLVRRAYDAFGPDRMMWGYFGHDRAGFEKEGEQFEFVFDFAQETDKAKIRGRNAVRVFGF